MLLVISLLTLSMSVWLNGALIYAGLERSCPKDSKNVSNVDVGLVQICIDLILS